MKLIRKVEIVFVSLSTHVNFDTTVMNFDRSWQWRSKLKVVTRIQILIMSTQYVYNTFNLIFL